MAYGLAREAFNFHGNLAVKLEFFLDEGDYGYERCVIEIPEEPIDAVIELPLGGREVGIAVKDVGAINDTPLTRTPFSKKLSALASYFPPF